MLRRLLLTKLSEDDLSIYTCKINFVCHVSLAKMLSFTTKSQANRLNDMKQHEELWFMLTETIIKKCEVK